MSRKKRNTPFQPGHGLLYGLRPVARDSETNTVTSVACRFCEKFGREEKAGAKRRATQRVKHFKQPFRTENYHQHHTGQHRTRWSEYKLLPPERKVAYLASPGELAGQDTYAPIADVANQAATTAVATAVGSEANHTKPQSSLTNITTLHPSRPQPPPVPFKFLVDKAIIEYVIGEMLVDTTHENTTKDRAINAFTSPTHSAIKDYSVKITNTQLFDATIAYVSEGATPRVAAAMIAEMAKTASPANGELRPLSECSEAKVSAYIRCAIAYNLQALADILRVVWAFGLSLSRVEYLNNCYLDVGVRVCASDDIHNFHLISCPIPDRFNLDPIYKTISTVLDALNGEWRHHLVGLGTDGSDAAETVSADILQRVLPHTWSNIFRTWSGAYQLDKIIRSVYRAVLDETYFDTLRNLISFLRRQTDLCNELRSQCPKVAASSWLSLLCALRWIRYHRLRILQFLEQKKPGFGPTLGWWVQTMGLIEFTKAVGKTYKRINGLTTGISKQLAHLEELLDTLQRISGCKGPITPDELNLLSQWDLIIEGKYVVQKTAVRNFLSGLGSFVHISTNELSDTSCDDVVHNVGVMYLSAVVKLSSLIDSRKESSMASGDIVPVLPNELPKQSRVNFNRGIRIHAHRLVTSFTPADIEQVETEFGDFLEAYHREEMFNSAVHAVSHHTSFTTSWGVLRTRFKKLFEFCGGVASGYPGKYISTPEFSILRDDPEMFHIQGMTDFPLEGSLHCQQYKRLKDLLEAVQSDDKPFIPVYDP